MRRDRLAPGTTTTAEQELRLKMGLQQMNPIQAAVSGVRLHQASTADEYDVRPPLTVRATSAGGRYDDGIPERTVEEAEREEAERDAAEQARLADIAEGDRLERERLERHRLRASGVAASLRSKLSRPVIHVKSGREFPSASAAAKAMKVNESGIRHSLKTGRTCGGSLWRRPEGFESSSAASPARFTARPVLRIDDGRVFVSDAAACAELKIVRNSIRQAIGNKHRAGGANWRYATPEEAAASGIVTPAAPPSTPRKRALPAKPAAPVRQTPPIQLPPAPLPVYAPTSEAMTFIAKAMFSLGKGGADLSGDALLGAIDRARQLADLRNTIAMIEQGSALTSLEGPNAVLARMAEQHEAAQPEEVAAHEPSTFRRGATG